MNLSGMTALVTGAGKRIGREICKTLASEGINIVIHYNNSKKEAEDLKNELDKFGIDAWLLEADFNKEDSYLRLIERTADIAGKLDILINNASIFQPGTLNDIKWEDLTENMKINFWVPFYLCRSFAEIIKKGSIINLLDSKISGFDYKHAGYIFSKQLLANFTVAAALEYAPHIRINGIAPGLILPPAGKDDSYMDKIADFLPLKMHGEAHHITDSVIFLLKNNFITGQLIYVDGGRRLKESLDG